MATTSMSDKTLKEAVMRELEWDPSVEAAHIGVIAKDGAVTLTGKVPTYSQKWAAVQAGIRRTSRRRRAGGQTVQPEHP